MAMVYQNKAADGIRAGADGISAPARSGMGSPDTVGGFISPTQTAPHV
jgi:hypothetical protein